MITITTSTHSNGYTEYLQCSTDFIWENHTYINNGEDINAIFRRCPPKGHKDLVLCIVADIGTRTCIRFIQ